MQVRGMLYLPATESKLFQPCNKEITMISDPEPASLKAFQIMSKHFPRAWGFLWGIEENSLSSTLLKCSEKQREVIYRQLSRRDCMELRKITNEDEKSCISPGLITLGGEKGKRIISETYKCVGLPPLVSFNSDLVLLDLKNKVPLSWIVCDAPAAFNIHPAPPEKPGAGVYVPSLLANEKKYGCTLHVMNSRVDDGPIIAVRRFSIPEGATRSVLKELTANAALEMFEDLMLSLKFTEPMSDIHTTCHYTWGGQEITRRMVKKMMKEAENKYGTKGHPALL